MLKIFKKIFHNLDKETIEIFEEETKIDYDSRIFLSLEVLSLSNSRLQNLTPLAVFKNLKILNLSNNNIEDISCLKDLKKLRIIDLRFNKIKNLPLWVFKLNKTIYWDRESEEQEGIFLEGNPLDKKLIAKIKNYPKQNSSLPIILKSKTSSTNKAMPKPSSITTIPRTIKRKKIESTKRIEIEKLIPLKRVHIAIFVPQTSSSEFLNNFITSYTHELKLNVSIIEYNKKNEIVDANKWLSYPLHYIVLILKETECCLNPPILEYISKQYIKSQIFLIIESNRTENMREKITFFKTYNRSINLINIYHSFNSNSHQRIKEEIYTYLNRTPEANSLWKKSWIALRDEIERDKSGAITKEDFQTLANRHGLSQEIREDIFIYLKKIGLIKKDECCA